MTLYIATEDASGYDWTTTDVIGIAHSMGPLQEAVEADIRVHSGHQDDEIVWEETADGMTTTFEWKENGAGPSTHTYWIEEIIPLDGE